jgi:translocation-and-assembly-module (TAM) inner membrane subunit TamB-like protein
MRRRKTHKRIRHTIAVFAIIAGFVSTSVWIISSPQALRYAVAIANSRSKWKIEINDFNWSPIRSSINVQKLTLTEPTDGKKISIDGIKLDYKVLGFLRGKLVIDGLEIDGVEIIMPPKIKDTPNKKRERLNIAQLVLLKNLELNDGLIKQVSARLGEDKELDLDEARLTLSRSFFGGTRLSIRIDGLLYKSGEKILATAGMFSLGTTTRLEDWNNEFPYIDSLGGVVQLRNSILSGMPVDELKAKIYYNDGDLKLTELNIGVEERTLTGSLSSNIETENFELAIDIERPLPLPHFGKPIKTIDLGGSIRGKIRLSGKGYALNRNSGKGSVDITHTFDVDKEAPLSVKADATWNSGVITLNETRAILGENTLLISGMIDIPGKDISIAAEGSGIEIGDVFRKFTNPHLQRIFGKADVKATFGGWGKDFSTRVNGLVTGGGWLPMVVQRADVELNATYSTLDLTVTIFDEDEKTGSADLKIEFGPKMGAKDRSKQIDLSAKLENHPLDKTMAEFDLSGVATGTIKLVGPPTSFSGESRIEVVDGAWHGIAFDRTSTDISLTRKLIEFSKLHFKPKVLGELTLPGKLFIELPGGKLVLKGNPTPNLELNSSYTFASKKWNITDITWKSLDNMMVSAKGTVVSGGPMNLRIKGNTDITSLRPFTLRFLDGKGPIGIDLALKGLSSNPQIHGGISLKDTKVIMRTLGLSFENIYGDLKFNGQRINLENINAESGDGIVRITGSLNHKNLKPTRADIKLDATSMVYRSPDRTMMVEFEGDIALAGNFPSPLIKGKMLILDGKYTRDFKILEAMGGNKKLERVVEPKISDFNPRLDLSVKSSGEMEIENNVGDIWLNVNIDVKGSARKPTISGAITTSGGEVHYLGLQFDISNGFVEFREKYEKPFMEIHAEKEIDTYNINLTLYGPTDNLKLDLTATSPSGPLEKRDVVSLLIFGVTEQERIEAAERTGGRFTASMVAQSITGVIQRPVTKFTKLDVFRFESSKDSSDAISRIRVGKKVSDRLSVAMTTDIDTKDAVQTILAEYLITDTLLISGSRSSDSQHEISGKLRFRLR